MKCTPRHCSTGEERSSTSDSSSDEISENGDENGNSNVRISFQGHELEYEM